MALRRPLTEFWRYAARFSQALQQDTGEDDEHAHEDGQVGVVAVWPDDGRERRIGGRVVERIDQRASAEDQESGSHGGRLHQLLVVSQVLC
jgi:hypothetical protein